MGNKQKVCANCDYLFVDGTEGKCFRPFAFGEFMYNPEFDLTKSVVFKSTCKIWSPRKVNKGEAS